jgi:hypothetical protein
LTYPADRSVNLDASGNASALGTPVSATLTNATGLPVATGISGLGSGVATFLATPSSANLAAAVSDETGTGALVFANSPTLVTPALGTPSALVGTNITGTAAGLTAGNVTTNANLTGAVTSTGNATLLGSFSSANLAGALTDETGTGSAVFATSPTLVTPALGTPASGVVTNLTGTASININGTVGATTASTGAFTTLSASGDVTLSGGTANGVAYLNGSKVLTTGSAVQYDGSQFSVTTAGNSPVNFSSTSTSNTLIQLTNSNASKDLISRFRQNNGGGNWWDLTMEGSTNGFTFDYNDGEILRLTSAGNVGIGTSLPATKLTVANAATGIPIVRLTGFNDSAARAPFGVLQFYNEDGSGQGPNIAASIKALNVSADGSGGQLSFSTSTGTGSEGAEASETMVLDGSGNLGIGTSSPATALSFPIGTSKFVGQTATTTHQAGNAGSIGFGISDGGNQSGVFVENTHNGTYSSQQILFKTAEGGISVATERMRLDSSGNLGLGVTPSAPSSADYKSMQLGSGGMISGHTSTALPWTLINTNHYFNASNVPVRINDGFAPRYMVRGDDGSHSWWTAPNSTAGTTVTFTQAMTLDASGNLGLGVTPSAWSTSFNIKAFDVGSKGSFYASDNDANVSFNQFFNGANVVYKTTGVAMRYAQSSDGHIWRTAPSGTAGDAISFSQVMTLDANGNLMVGTTTIGTGNRMNVVGNNVVFSPNTAGKDTHTFSTAAADVGTYVIKNDTTTNVQLHAGGVSYFNGGNVGIGTSSPGGLLQVGVPNTATGSLRAYSGFVNIDAGYQSSNVSGTAAAPSLIWAGDDNTGIWHPASDTLAISTAGSERARIDSSGNLLVGTTSTAFTGRVVTLQTTSASDVITAWNSATSGDNSLIGFFTDGGSGRGSISYNRAGGLVAYNVTSDYRAKDISGPVVGSGALIDSVPVYMGKMKDATQERPMFIAHETPAYAHTGVKDAVDVDGNPVYQQMDASALIPVMWAEIQSLRARLAALESI